VRGYQRDWNKKLVCVYPRIVPLTIVYLSIGLRAKGGIARYSRYQIRALRELVGPRNLFVCSLIGAGDNDFEDEFAIDYEGKGTGIVSETRFLLSAIEKCWTTSPVIIWSDHVRFLPNLMISHLFTPAASLLVNVYGEELWSGTRLLLNKRLLPWTHMVLADCHFSADFVREQYGINGDRVRVVWDCVDLDRFRPHEGGRDVLRSFGVPVTESTRYLLTLGRIERKSQYKGYDRLLDVLGSIREHQDIIFIFAGEGDYRPVLEQRVRDEHLEGRALFLGSISESELVEVYNSCDIFALVSDRGEGRGEGIPLTPLEAAACGKPIIVGNEDGSREAVIDGVTGRLVSPRDPVALREAVLELLLDRDQSVRMGRAARQRIEAEFSYRTFKTKLATVLGELSRSIEWQSMMCQ
jgi:phosphatidylinositol alpha-1,6-mannosyltransferase